MDRERWLEEKRQEAHDLGDLATASLVPSRRDFTQFIASQRRELALVPRLMRRDPVSGVTWPERDLVALARILDDTEVAALAVATASFHGCEGGDLRAISDAVSAPVLRDDLCIEQRQIFDSRLRGADAVCIPLAELEGGEVETLADIAISVHMTPVLEVNAAADLDKLRPRVPCAVGLRCSGADGYADLAAARRLAAMVEPPVVVILLAEPRHAAELEDMRGHVDGVVAGAAILAASDVEAAVGAILEGS